MLMRLIFYDGEQRFLNWGVWCGKLYYYKTISTGGTFVGSAGRLQKEGGYLGCYSLLG